MTQKLLNMEKPARFIIETYEKYNGKSNKIRYEEGSVIPVSTVKVLSWLNGKLKIVNSINAPLY